MIAVGRNLADAFQLPIAVGSNHSDAFLLNLDRLGGEVKKNSSIDAYSFNVLIFTLDSRSSLYYYTKLNH